jgi:hypothetical protein
MTTTTSIMLRSASRGARSLSEHLGRKRVTNLRLNHRSSASGTVSRTFGTQHNNDDVFSALSAANGAFSQEPQPMLAVAYDYYDDDFEEEDDDAAQIIGNTSSDPHFSAQHAVKHDVTSRRIGMPLSSASDGSTGRGPSSSTPYPPPSSMISQKAGASRKVGGGGSGRHRCPKCGTTVTFRCDYEDNTFYCASCSGWFVVNPNTVHANEDGKPDGSPYEEFMAKNGPRKASDPEILMRHVSYVKLLQCRASTVSSLLYAHPYYSYCYYYL